ncbi:hypothetical protein FPV67DRAFT_1565461 [Lyophyllum atratum]|nr:hypothetical protein FPV67DRAFT_1565461 [Lyophyllum atratum]
MNLSLATMDVYSALTVIQGSVLVQQASKTSISAIVILLHVTRTLRRCVSQDEDAWEKYNGPLDTMLQKPPEDIRALVRVGELGLAGLCRFLEYLVVNHGIKGGLIEGKLQRLMDAMDSVLKAYLSCPGALDSTVTAAIPSECFEGPPIDVDVLPDLAPLRNIAVNVSDDGERLACPGIVVSLPPGKSAHSTYPFGLHDELGDPWDYTVNRGVLTLRSKGCATEVLSDGSVRCLACEDLQENPNLDGILHRMRNGVHENARLVFHGVGGLITINRQKQGLVKALRLKRLNDARKLVGKAAALENYKRWVLAVGSGKVERVDRLVKINLRRRGGIQSLLTMYDRAAQQVYHPQSYSEEDQLRGLLLWRLGGARVAHIAHRALGLPSLSTLRRHSLIPQLLVSPSAPTLLEMETNIANGFAPLFDALESRHVVHQVLMLDELKIEERPRVDPETNKIVGICREHGYKTSLEFNSEKEIELLLRGIKEKEIHFATEATVGAIGVLSSETHLYSARPVLVSGSCKRETGAEHATLVDTAYRASKKTKLRTVSIASDGESRRGEALVRLTFKQSLSPNSPIYDLLSPLPLLNLEVGDDDLTADKDYKHVFKRLRNLLLRPKGFLVHGVHITPSVIRSHLFSNEVNLTRADYLLNPNDKQDVKLAYDLLREIWLLPEPPTNRLPGFQHARKSFQTFGVLLYHVLTPYICVDHTLSEQLEHLSAAAHLLMALYAEERTGTRLMPTQLYVDIMIMIKNAYFCVAKAKIDDPDGSFFIIQLGTDRLETLFGILRTMIGNDANVDALQLGSRITGTTEVSSILATHPEWDKQPRRLKLPTLDKNGLEIHGRSDHLGPREWRGDTRLSPVNAQTCWKLGRLQIEERFPALVPVLESLAAFDMFSPLGKDLVKAPRDPDDVDDTVDEHDTAVTEDLSPGPELEDAAAESAVNTKFEPCFELDGKKVYKSRYLSQAFESYRKTGSTDRLKRVANVERYAYKAEKEFGVIEHDVEAGDNMLPMDSPIATLFRCENRLFLCVGEVVDIAVDSKHVDEVGVEYLSEPSTFVTYQVLDVVPASQEDDPDLKHDWSWSRRRGATHRVVGRLVQPINPAVCTRIAGEPFYLFESAVLMALGATILEQINMKRSERIPYREPGGKACFLVEDDLAERKLATDNICTACRPAVPLAKSAHRILEHMAGHIHFDERSIDRSAEPCGLCLRPAPLCTFYLKKSRGAGTSDQIDFAKSTCANKASFLYAIAAISTPSSPCSNVPIRCAVCPAAAPAVWRYNFPHHMRNKHPSISLSQYEPLYQISRSEKVQLKQSWDNQHKQKKSRKSKGKKAELVISQAHSSRLALRNGDVDLSDAEESDDGSRSTDEDSCAGVNNGEDVSSALEVDGNTSLDLNDDANEKQSMDVPSLGRGDSPMTLPPTPTTPAPPAPPAAVDDPPPASSTSFTTAAGAPGARAASPPPNNSMHEETDDVFRFEAAETRVGGRKRRARDLNAILTVCICGKKVSAEERQRENVALECKRVGCETGWVSKTNPRHCTTFTHRGRSSIT